MAPRPMKWHIFNDENEPLCWDDQALEFDEYDQVLRFLNSYLDAMGTSLEDYCKAFGVEFKKCIFYYDGGHLDCSHKIVVFGEDDWEGHLEDVE